MSFRHEMGRLIYARLIELDPDNADVFIDDIKDWLKRDEC